MDSKVYRAHPLFFPFGVRFEGDDSTGTMGLASQ
ncbi:hypothetical protein Htur_4259 (plasmid) [Haloterrigena turkmenica DSM 5511]|uniref:Uncharacterized protein n=1 Tax=Haloterrigena turkmenica (strain ATCC 51198 / DSM 5511 / JCM 9101 / NCIMB 13204 / VKM B-1734 / 4k) TaxID=543526 RepID=D2S131_HALTV|nr:hypothetical protein Htur_4259 [Haloterrigena turkmenica DSM 5511]